MTRVISRLRTNWYQARAERTRQRTEKAKENSDRAIARYTFWLGAFTALLVVVGVLQFGIGVLQLRELDGADIQTARMERIQRYQSGQIAREANEMHELALKMKDQAVNTKTVADRTHEVAQQAKIQAQAARQLAANTGSQLDVMERTFEVNFRPFLRFAIDKPDDIALRLVPESRRVEVSLKGWLSNDGIEQAERISQAFHFLGDRGDPILLKEDWSICREAESMTPHLPEIIERVLHNATPKRTFFGVPGNWLLYSPTHVRGCFAYHMKDVELTFYHRFDLRFEYDVKTDGSILAKNIIFLTDDSTSARVPDNVRQIRKTR
jgi:hypothetical protein